MDQENRPPTSWWVKLRGPRARILACLVLTISVIICTAAIMIPILVTRSRNEKHSAEVLLEETDTDFLRVFLVAFDNEKQQGGVKKVLELLPVYLRSYVQETVLETSGISLVTVLNVSLADVKEFNEIYETRNVYTDVLNIVKDIIEAQPDLKSILRDRASRFALPKSGEALLGNDVTTSDGSVLDPAMDPPWQASLLKYSQAFAISQGSPEIIVAVMDTGCDLTHPALVDRIWINSGEIPGNERDDDGNGYVDDVHGYDFAGDCVSCGGRPIPADSRSGHGTHCAGIVAGRAIGIAPNVRIMCLKVATTAESTFLLASILAAFDYAHRMGAHVISCSFGPSRPNFNPSPRQQSIMQNETLLYRRALAPLIKKDVLIAISAGNENANLDLLDSTNSTYQPCFMSREFPTNILCVMATDSMDRRWSEVDMRFNEEMGTNYGFRRVDIGAPGRDIVSSVPPLTSYNGALYADKTGSSMAAPMVAGLGALVLSVLSSPETAVADHFRGAMARSIIVNSADRIAGLPVRTESRINAFSAVSQALVLAGSPKNINNDTRIVLPVVPSSRRTTSGTDVEIYGSLMLTYFRMNNSYHTSDTETARRDSFPASPMGGDPDLQLLDRSIRATWTTYTSTEFSDFKYVGPDIMAVFHGQVDVVAPWRTNTSTQTDNNLTRGLQLTLKSRIANIQSSRVLVRLGKSEMPPMDCTVELSQVRIPNDTRSYDTYDVEIWIMAPSVSDSVQMTWSSLTQPPTHVVRVNYNSSSTSSSSDLPSNTVSGHSLDGDVGLASMLPATVSVAYDMLNASSIKYETLLNQLDGDLLPMLMAQNTDAIIHKILHMRIAVDMSMILRTNPGFRLSLTCGGTCFVRWGTLRLIDKPAPGNGTSISGCFQMPGILDDVTLEATYVNITSATGATLSLRWLPCNDSDSNDIMQVVFNRHLWNISRPGIAYVPGLQCDVLPDVSALSSLDLNRPILKFRLPVQTPCPTTNPGATCYGAGNDDPAMAADAFSLSDIFSSLGQDIDLTGTILQSVRVTCWTFVLYQTSDISITSSWSFRGSDDYATTAYLGGRLLVSSPGTGRIISVNVPPIKYQGNNDVYRRFVITWRQVSPRARLGIQGLRLESSPFNTVLPMGLDGDLWDMDRGMDRTPRNAGFGAAFYRVGLSSSTLESKEDNPALLNSVTSDYATREYRTALKMYLGRTTMRTGANRTLWLVAGSDGGLTRYGQLNSSLCLIMKTTNASMVTVTNRIGIQLSVRDAPAHATHVSAQHVTLRNSPEYPARFVMMTSDVIYFSLGQKSGSGNRVQWCLSGVQVTIKTRRPERGLLVYVDVRVVDAVDSENVVDAMWQT